MHPSEIIAETLENMNVSLRQFAKSMEIDPSIASKCSLGIGSLRLKWRCGCPS
ncbi:hypothetical protein XBP1_1620013 [Xenorhabdus bovienii str. puntauvense]|uniref:Uncharacterized protein n=1 Tax=Xenorhabdus bovienii str. puntauvense TaxID=1398201 RepID=A0A077ND29_XENBV|nr:hypothetical protein XBP1_1620013 [Xenorhabdus bovienii str. puntauvense]